ncbi:MAG: hypothetical protein ABJC66_16205 [Gammaproteobacteria bacterium]
MNRAMIIFVFCAGGALMACSAAKNDWTEAKATDTLSAYESFVQNHPKDSHVDEARGRILALKDDQAWAMAQSANNVASYSEYLKAESGGVHADDARFQLTALDRAAAWKSAQSDPSVATLEKFLQKYPEGTESNEARQKLASMAYRALMDESRSKAGAERNRVHLQALFGAIVHEVVVVPPAAPDTHYQVTSGPMSQADADSTCTALKRKHQHCTVIKDTGSSG